MALDDDADDLDAALTRLEDSLSRSTDLTAAFDAELVRMRDEMVFTNREVSRLGRSFGHDLRSAFDGVIFDGLTLSDALRGLARDMSAAVYDTAMKPVQNALGGALAGGLNALTSGLFGFADGGAFAQGRVMPFAKGGVVTGPTLFPMRGATGLMGEAGAEAILPLARGADGRLGVAAQGGGRPVSVVMNITTPDVAGFQKSKSQIAAEMGRALARGSRNR